MRPELLNRLDDVVIFNLLTGDVLRQVVRLQLEDVLKRLEELQVSMNMTDAALDHVLKEAHDPQMGARPLKRYLERHLVSHLSVLILQDELPPASSVTVDWPADGKEWDFKITKGVLNDDDDDDLPRTTTATLGRAGGRDHYNPLHRTDSTSSSSKRARVGYP